ncbi:hypothetical protein NL676_027738 [Syzygium grande]|nr:hypothetical protein NL676_027738 [Syzygium grande]
MVEILLIRGGELRAISGGLPTAATWKSARPAGRSRGAPDLHMLRRGFLPSVVWVGGRESSSSAWVGPAYVWTVASSDREDILPLSQWNSHGRCFSGQLR